MQINGQPISTAAGSTLSQLLAQQGFDVARNSFQQHWLNGTDRNASSICTPPVSVSPV